ncbi:MAG: hypothetical protein HC859_11680 [Bacteroidia bacterium]|nr:hypothetical protein [Bacteroidia bacterium]
MNFQSPRITLDGATYNGTAYFEKTAASTDNSSGNNIFNQQTTIANSGPGDFRHGVSALDTYNADLIIANSGAGAIAMARNTAGNIFNGNIQVNSTAGNGVSFGTGNGTSTLAAGRTIAIGVSGFSTGILELRNFTQTGATPQNLTLTGTALLQVGTNSTFNGNVTFVSPQVLLQGCSYMAPHTSRRMATATTPALATTSSTTLPPS